MNGPLLTIMTTDMYVGAAGKREISSFKPRKQSVPYNLILCWLYYVPLSSFLCSTKVFALSGYLQFNIFVVTRFVPCLKYIHFLEPESLF